jgi:hypothetical protein
LKVRVSLTQDGILLHAKHALMPNKLGYCGPDENSRLLESLHNRSPNDEVLTTLKRFEAAYPFIRMIAKSTGRNPFDYDVTEAYWIGNPLLEHVEPAQFFDFAHQGLSSHLDRETAKELFSLLGKSAKPHHTFYVLGMYSKATGSSATDTKLLQLMDSCRISWGKVVEVKERTLLVERDPLTLNDNHLVLAGPQRKEIAYDREISPFEKIERGEWVSIHWDFACEKLKGYQLKNLTSYTSLDVEAVNRFSRLSQKSGKA